MNKKFSTLVAALLASGGLFYAVDAMILPAGDGVAQKYVMVETRAGAVAEDYSVTIASISEADLAVATVWTVDAATNPGYYYLKTGKGSYLAKSTDGASIILAKGGSVTPELYLAVTIESGLVKVGTQYLVISEGQLQLAETTEGAVSLFNAASEALGNIALAASNKYAVAEAKASYADFASETHSSVKATATVEQVGIAIGSGYGASTVVSLVKPEGFTNYVLYVGNGLYLQKQSGDNTFEYVTATGLVEALAAVADAGSGVITIGGIKIGITQGGGVAYNVSGTTYITKAAYNSSMTGKVILEADLGGEIDNNDNMRLATINSLGTLSGSDYALQLTHTNALTYVNDEDFAAATKWTYDKTSQTLGNLGFNLKAAGASTGQSVTAVYDDKTATVTAITLDEDGAVKIAGVFLVNNGGIQTKAAATPAEKLYLYSAAGTIETNLSEVGEKELVLGTKVAKTILGANGITKVTEQEAVPATPGSEIPGMDKVEVDANGTITPNEETTIVAPVEISLGNGDFLSIGTGNKVIKVAAEDVSVKASWILKDSKYMSVALDRAGVDKKYLKYTNPTNGGLNLQAAEVVAQGFELVAEKDASEATFKGTTIVLGSQELTSSFMKVSDQANPEAPATSGGQALVAEVGSDSYLLSAKDGKFVSESGVVTATNDATALWKVETTTLANGVINYSFYHMKEGKKTYLDLEGKVFTAKGDIAYFKGVMLTTETGKWVNVAGDGSLVVDGQQGTVLGLYEAGATAYSAAELNKFEGAGFSLTIDTKKDAKATIKGADMFAGKLMAVETGGTGKNTTYQLKTADGKFVVLLQKGADNAAWGTGSDMNGEGTYKRGYKFSTVKEIKTGEKYLSNFCISHAAGSDSKDLIVEVLNGDNTVFGRLYIAKVDGEYLLTTTDGKATNDVYPYVVAGNGNAITLKALVEGGRFVNISYVNSKKVTGEGGNLDRFGKVYTVGLKDNGDMEVGYAKLNTEVLASSPETQWAISGADGGIIFANREQPTVKTEALALYATATPDVYSIEKVNKATSGVTFRDTIRLTYVENTKKFDGFMFAKENQLRNQRYNLSAVNKINEVTQQMYWAENTGTHKIGLDGDSENASKWKLALSKKDDKDGNATLIDTVLVISNVSIIKDNKVVTVPDTLAILPYIFQNAANSEYVKSNDKSMEDGKFYICDKDKVEANATRFALKMRPDSTYHFVTLDMDNTNSDNKVAPYANPFTNKLYGDRINNWLGNASNYSVAKGNDLMAVTPLDVPEYRQVAFGDTIRIYREENDSQVMYEKRDASVLVEGQAPSFLNIDNVNQFTKINPAIFVDTAYVNREAGENTRYQYLLAVNVEEKTDAVCPLNPEHNTQAWRDEHNNGKPCPDAVKSHYLKGRFLINLMDTANVYEAKQLHSKNPYIDRNEAGEPCAKLAFVEGYHLNDTLFIQRGNGEYVKLRLDDANFNIAKFAFHYDNYAEGTFKIQTQIKNWKDGDLDVEDDVNNDGYLKWINGTVVVAQDYKAGDVFNLNEDETRIPTANEGINASEVSVIAKEGAVIINGAAGKKVTISNVLGQTIANTVLSSDNATISAPAGIVVVAVEGEAAVKAIVK